MYNIQLQLYNACMYDNSIMIFVAHTYMSIDIKGPYTNMSPLPHCMTYFIQAYISMHLKLKSRN